MLTQAYNTYAGLALAQCDQQAAGAACLQPLNQAKAATCECIDEAREDLKRRIAGIGNLLCLYPRI